MSSLGVYMSILRCNINSTFHVITVNCELNSVLKCSMTVEACEKMQLYENLEYVNSLVSL